MKPTNIDNVMYMYIRKPADEQYINIKKDNKIGSDKEIVCLSQTSVEFFEHRNLGPVSKATRVGRI